MSDPTIAKTPPTTAATIAPRKAVTAGPRRSAACRRRRDVVTGVIAEKAGSRAPITRSGDLEAIAFWCPRTRGGHKYPHRRTPCSHSSFASLDFSTHWTTTGTTPNPTSSIRSPVEAARAMRIGRNVEVRPLGGGVGCLAMILFSVIASVLLTVLVNVLARL